MALELRRATRDLSDGRQVFLIYPVSNHEDERRASNETFKTKRFLKQNGANWNAMQQRWEWLAFKPEEKDYIAKKASKAVDEANTFLLQKENLISDFIKKFEDIKEGLSNSEMNNSKKADDLLESIKSFISDLENEVDEAKFNEKIQEYFQFAASMRNYSANNIFLIMIQNRNATDVRSKTNWELVGRRPKKNAKPIFLLRPNLKKKSQSQKNRDEADFRRAKGYSPNDTLSKPDAVKLLQIQNQGIKLPGYVTYFAYDISQVEQIPHSDKYVEPDVAWSNTEKDERAEQLLKATVQAIESLGITVEFHDEEKMGGSKGYSASGKIVLNKSNVGKGAFSVAVHELAHELLHQSFLSSSLKDKKDRTAKEQDLVDLYVGRMGETKTKELQAEAVAYVVLRAFGYRLQESVNYIVLFRNDRQNIQQNIDVITKTANKIINEIRVYSDSNLRENQQTGELTTNQVAAILGVENMLDQTLGEKEELMENFRAKASMYFFKKIIKENASYESWAKTAEPIESVQVNRNTYRDIYKSPNGIIIIDNTVLPSNFLKKSHSYAYVDLQIPNTEENKELVRKYGGTIEDIYSEEGYGVPFFKSEDDALKMAFEFSVNEGDRLRK